VPARRPGRQAHSVVGATITSGRAAAALPGICPGRDRRGRGAACRMPCRSRDPVPPACLAAGRAPAGPRFRPGTGQAPVDGCRVSGDCRLARHTDADLSPREGAGHLEGGADARPPDALARTLAGPAPRGDRPQDQLTPVFLSARVGGSSWPPPSS